MNNVKDVKDVKMVNDVKDECVQKVNGELIWETFFSQLLYQRIHRNTGIV